MVQVVNWFKVAPGKTRQAEEWAKKIAAYDKKKGIWGSPTVLRPLTGETGTLVFVAHNASLAEFEDFRRKRMADPGWTAIIKEMRESEWYLGTTRQVFDVVVE